MSKSSTSFRDRLTYTRAFEAVVWATPFLNTLQMRRELERLGISGGKLAYIGSPPGPNLILPTFNNQTAYVFGSLDLSEGPMVMEIPAESKKAKLFGTFANVWDDPLADIGPAGADKGQGGSYVLLPPDYDCEVSKYAITVRSNSYDVHMWFRSVAKTDNADKAWKDSAKYLNKIKLYPLGGKSAKLEAIDVTQIDGDLVGNIMADHDVFGLIDNYIQEEPVQPENLAFRGLLKELGIAKDVEFAPDTATQAILDQAKVDAFAYMEDYLAAGKALVPYWGNERNWGAFRITPEVLESGGTWNFKDYRDYHARTLDFAFWAVGIPVNYDNEGGGSTFYLFSSTDASGKPLDSKKTYRLTVPANVPAEDFWSVLLYSTKTRSFVNSSRFGLSSLDDLVVNDDDTVDLYIGQSAPKGFKKNLLKMNRKEGTFLAFRFYGPTEELTSGKWKLNDPVLVE